MTRVLIMALLTSFPFFAHATTLQQLVPGGADWVLEISANDGFTTQTRTARAPIEVGSLRIELVGVLSPQNAVVEVSISGPASFDVAFGPADSIPVSVTYPQIEYQWSTVGYLTTNSLQPQTISRIAGLASFETPLGTTGFGFGFLPQLGCLGGSVCFQPNNPFMISSLGSTQITSGSPLTSLTLEQDFGLGGLEWYISLRPEFTSLNFAIPEPSPGLLASLAVAALAAGRRYRRS